MSDAVLHDRHHMEKEARKAAAEDFALAAHYANLIIDHLQVGDDCGAIWDQEQFKAAGRRAFAAFAPIRNRMRTGQTAPEHRETAE